jgi:glycosyltransferase 2 family protein
LSGSERNPPPAAARPEEASDTAPATTSAAKPRHPSRSRAVQGAISLALLALLAFFVDLGAVGEALAATHAAALAGAFVLALVDRALMIGKWFPMLRVQVPGATLGQATRAYLAAGFTNYFLPSTVGSDALRAAAVGRPHGRILEVGASIAAERLFGMLANGVLVLVSVAVALDRAVHVGLAGPLALGLFVAAALAVLLPFSERARALGRRLLPRSLAERRGGLLRRFFGAYLGYRRHPGMLAVVGALTLIEVLFPLAILLVLSLGMEGGPGFVALLVAVPISSLIAKVPISVAGVGPQEAVLVSLLAVFGVPPGHGLALAILVRLIDVLIAIPGAFFWRELARGMDRAGPPAPGAVR